MLVNQQVFPIFLDSPLGVIYSSILDSPPNHILFSFISGKTSLYVIAFTLPITMNFLFSKKLINSLNKLNGGLVIITSASSLYIPISLLLKSPSPSK